MHMCLDRDDCSWRDTQCRSRDSKARSVAVGRSDAPAGTDVPRLTKRGTAGRCPVMSTSTHGQMIPHPATNAIDIAEAAKLARGPAQQRWLAELTTVSGLRVADHLPRRWSTATYDRMTAFFTKLWAAGYDLSNQPGPRGGRGTWHLVGYQPGQAPHRHIIAALGYNIASAKDRWQPTRLYTALDAEAPATVRNAADLLHLVSWVAWHGIPGDTPAPDALARVLDACRAPAGSTTGSSRGELLARLLNDSRAGGASITLGKAAVIADALTMRPRANLVSP